MADGHDAFDHILQMTLHEAMSHRIPSHRSSLEPINITSRHESILSTLGAQLAGAMISSLADDFDDESI
ncbi:MAG: hypothetical protein Q8P67_11600 [archaeon]|nr:hypothetical protein [archaeon]